ncbi:MAG TPA: putative DNA binding domain-containing protein [Caldisericia bacterium]|nr:putative DNA binding domain-containing protein [Caldisericia bacterium]
MLEKEDQQNEWKREYTEEVKKTIIAFANSQGGTLYIGVNNDGSIHGISDIDKLMCQISNSIREAVKPDLTMFVDYQTEYINEKTILKVFVQKGTSSPYYLAQKGIRPEGVFVRQGSSSVPASDSYIVQMIKNTDGDRYEDIRSVNQDLSFDEAKKEFEKKNITFGMNQKRTLGLVNEEGLITNLGLLLSDQCPHSIKIAVFEDQKMKAYRDREIFSGSLFAQLHSSYAFIDRYNPKFSSFSGINRIDKRAYPEEAIREALLNSIIHRDYSFSGSILIHIYSDRMVFISIGGLLKGINESDIRLGVSVARNEKLAQIFYRLGYVEAFGTGIPKIMQSYMENPLKPTIEVSNHAFKVVLPQRMDTSTAPRESMTYSTHEDKVINLLKENEATIKREDAEKVLHLSQAMTSRILKELIKKGKLVSVGKGRNTRYILK